MTDPGLARVEPILLEALQLEPGARAAFLDRVCGSDEALRREAESLLALDPAAAAFLERPAIEAAARALHDEATTASLVGRVLGDYRVEAVIGRGGMGEVYRAYDRQLMRAVAVKVLGPAPPTGGDRTPALAEAQASSRLAHPNIVTVYGVGEADGLAFIVMELVRGRTLRERLAAGPLPLVETMALALQLADALAAAHDEGVVHRDLKPENVMITAGGHLKVLDFGIAGRSDGAAGGWHGGTAGYMAPEQVSGEPALPASDQFSFGVILHEMLTGQPPGGLAAAPPYELPPALADVLRRCLAAAPADRFATTADLVTALRMVPLPVARGVTRRRLLQGAFVATAAAATAGVVWGVGPWAGRRRVVAVLPFANQSADGDADHLAEGLTATLIERLGVMPSLTVLPRSLVFNFRGAAATRAASELGRELGADVVLAGTIGRRGTMLDVAARLDEVGSGRTLWAATFVRPATELLVVEEEIAQAIVDQGVRLRLSADQRRRLLRRTTTDPVAYEQYLRAVHLCQQETEDAYLEARELLDDALARDPRFGAGHVQLATTYAVMAVDGMERPTDAWPESSRHVRLALAGDPDLADAYACTAAQEFFFNWNWDAAEDAWRLAMRFGGGEVHPDLYTARALQRAALGRMDEALTFVRRARQVDPVTPMFAIREADLLLRAGDPGAAALSYRRVLAGQPDEPRALAGLAAACVDLGRLDEAVALRRRLHGLAGDADALAGGPAATATAELRRLDRAGADAELRILAIRERGGDYVSPLDVARQYARLGDHDAAARRFDAALADRAPGLAMLDLDPAWEGMRSDPRFLAVRRRVGLT
ncbi:MAG: protein kinase [Vicinamibacterales bacterium]